MRADFDGIAIFVQLQEHILRHFLRNSAIAEKVVRDAVNHSLLLVYDDFELRLCHLPSPANNGTARRYYAKF
jgi:hypothetical protein